MPFEGSEGTTPVKPQWSKLNISNVSLDETDKSSTGMKSFMESSNLDESGEWISLLTRDLSMMSLREESEHNVSTNTSSFEKSGYFRDSGISSLDIEAEAGIVSSPTEEESQESLKFQYKISIYSKVSGCRFTNLTDYYIVKQIRVAVLQHLTKGDPIQALKFKFGYEKMANGGLQIISDSEVLINMLGSLSYFAGIPCKMTFPDTPRVVGFIKGLPTDLEPSDLKDEIRKSYPEVYSVRYVTEKSRGSSKEMQRPCAFISFNLKILPKIVKIFNKMFELQVPNPMQCTRCCRYGHQGKQCRAQARCSFCGGTHQRQLCTAKTPTCINCFGQHAATSHECSIWQQGKHMNKLRYRGGLSAEDAINIASDGKVSQKKHIFTPADFFGNQDSFYFGGDKFGEDFEPKDDADVLEEPAQITLGKVPPLHPRACRIFPFLDLMTDLYLKVKNPGSNYTSSVLMPGYDDLGFPINKQSKTNSAVAQHFKESVKAMIYNSPNAKSRESSPDI